MFWCGFGGGVGCFHGPTGLLKQHIDFNGPQDICHFVMVKRIMIIND